VQEARTEEADAAPPNEVPPPPPAPARSGGFVGRLVFYGFVISTVLFVLVVVRAEVLLNGTGRAGVQIAIAIVLLAEAGLLLRNWRGANQRLGQRLLTRVWGPRGPVTRGERIFARTVRDLLTLVGIVWLATGVFELLSATVGT
jgi:hypothetical protein